MGIISEKLFQSILEKKQHEPERNYLGFSAVGHPCARYLWLSYHKKELKKPLMPKQAAIFENGHWVENKIIHQMRQAGLEITDQQKEGRLINGYFKGHIEGFIENHPEYGKIPFEIKGINQTSFKSLEKKGVKNEFYSYYVQAQMNMSVHGFDKLVFIAENKNNQDLYEEIIYLDSDCVEETIKKAESIIYGDIPDPVSYRIDWYQCFNCQFNHDKACRKQWKEKRPF